MIDYEKIHLEVERIRSECYRAAMEAARLRSCGTDWELEAECLALQGAKC